MNFQLLIFLCWAVVTALGQKDPHFVGNRTTIVHLFEWKWLAIAAECENFLTQKGYGGVQISPPNENLVVDNRPWWERYQPVSYIIQTRSGNEDEFRQMVQRCNNVGVRIYVDTVINHMSGLDGRGTANSEANHNDKYYPAVSYSNENFHATCAINDYNNADNVRNCELEGLRDLDHSQKYVQEKIRDYMNYLVDLGVAGFRVDAAKHMWPNDIRTIYESVKDLSTDMGFAANSRPFIFQEVIDINGDEAVTRDQYTGFGRVLEFRNGAQLASVFRDASQKLTYLNNWGPEWGLINDPNDAVVFVDNHDTERSNDAFINYKNSKVYKQAIAFMLAHPYSTPRILSGFNFNGKDDGPPQDGNGNLISAIFNADDTCSNGYTAQHRWRQIYNMVQFRNVVQGTNLNNWWSNGDQQIAFCRGNQGFIALTRGGNINQDMAVCVPSGKYCDVITGNVVNGQCTGKTVEVTNGNTAYISLNDNEDDGVLAIHVNARLQ